MPVLSLPVPRFGLGVLEYLPVRVPFPFMRIASILPQSINGPFKASLLALFRLAWSAKVQIPVLITVVFMACDIRLQLEINIIWENNRPNNVNRIGIDRGGNQRVQRGASGEEMRRTALVAAAIYQQQRRRLIQEIRAQQTQQRDLVVSRRRSVISAIPPVAPLAVEEDDNSDLDCSHTSDVDIDESDSDTICSQRSTTSEAGQFGSDEVDTEDAEDNEPVRKKKMTKRSRPSSKEPDEEGNDEDDEDTSTDEDEDDDDDDFAGGGGANGGSGSSHFGGGAGGGRYRDDSYDHDSDDMGDDNSNDESGTYSSPLVVEVEIRHRSLFPTNEFQMSSQTMRIPLPFMRYNYNSDKSGYFSQYYKNCPSVLKKLGSNIALMSPLHHL